MTDIASLMRRAEKPVSARPKAAARAKPEPGDMHPAHLANAIRKAERDGDTARLAHLKAAAPKE